MTATELRKNLFQVLDSVALGEPAEISHKGRTMRIVPADRSSRLARLIPRGGDASDGIESLSGWDDAAQAEWEAEHAELLGD